MHDKKDLWWWGKKKYSAEEIQKLVEKIKEWSSGAIDDYEEKYIDEVFEEWKEANN